MSLTSITTVQSYGNIDPFIHISQEEFLSGKNLNEKLTQAAQIGFFYLEMPNDCKILMDEAVSFANSFYAKKDIKEHKFEGFSGYHDRKEYQVESLYLERKYWKEQLPGQLLELAPKIHSLSVEVLKKTLNICQIPNQEQAKISGNATENKGNAYFTFNHYRPEKSSEGLASHRDFGQITVLFINQVGLQAKLGKNWVDVNPLEGYFIINFGRALETSINNPKKLTAAWHRVQQVTKDRISVGIFLDNDMDSMIYQKTPTGELVNTGDSFDSYLKKSFSEHYQE